MNAVEASASDSVVTLRAQDEGDHVRIDLENGNGPISESIVPSIFEPFFTTKLSGTGLGLAIAHNIARSHGGSLQLSLNTAEIVRFTLSLPGTTTKQDTEKA
jgi:two-component system sensor histidine kinase AtoS